MTIRSRKTSQRDGMMAAPQGLGTFDYVTRCTAWTIGGRQRPGHAESTAKRDEQLEAVNHMSKHIMSVLACAVLLSGVVAFSADAPQRQPVAPRVDRVARLPLATSYQYALSSGLFAVPEAAKVVDWAVVNDSGIRQTIRVTVYKCGIGAAKTPVPPGALELTLEPGFTSHNSNAVGSVYVKGFFYEVVMEANDKRVLPNVQIWQDSSGTVIPGTLIPAGAFVGIK